MLLTNARIHLRVNDDLTLDVCDHAGVGLWSSSAKHPPVMTVLTQAGKRLDVLLSSGGKRQIHPCDDDRSIGYRLHISAYEEVDVAIELAFSVDSATGELSVQVEQTGGADAVTGVNHLYRFEKPVADEGYMVLPHGSGYLIPSECPDELPGNRDPSCDNNRIGDRWSLPMFGMVSRGHGMCAIVETWWDCEVREEHVPGEYSALDINWIDSLGKLAYPRRFLLRFGEDMDYVAMAKWYRQYAEAQGLVRTLAEKAEQTPVIRQYIDNILYRWPAWNPEGRDAAFSDIKTLRGAGFGVNFFFPKWSSLGYSSETNTPNSADGGWQAYLLQDPVPGGWPVLTKFAEAARRIECPIQVMVTMPWNFPEAPEYDEARWPKDADGAIVGDTGIHYGLGAYDAVDRIKMVLDSLVVHHFPCDVVYLDGYSAFSGAPVDFSPDHPMTRRANFDAQNGCFGEIRRRGMMPSGELARFWCMAECDYFFYTDWSADRLVNGGNRTSTAPVGEPIPLFQLVFHDCYMAGFSGGGYADYSPGVDWWEDRNPRLYELMFGSAPAYNWLPKGKTPISDWDSDLMRRRLAWLHRWSAYHRAVATSEMISHQFISDGFLRHRIEFANGVAAEFDMEADRFRISGVCGFTGEWERPEDLRAGKQDK